MRRVRYADLSRLRCSMKKIAPFIIVADYAPARDTIPSETLRRAMADAPQQMNLWPELQAG
jgi:predicted DNA-binding helix-hairpin-helix protein